MKLKQLLAAATIALLAPAAHALSDGVDYHLIPGAAAPAGGTDETVEITYFFNFACPACNAFEGPLHVWLEDKPDYVKFVMVPVPWERTGFLYAESFYVLDGFGRTDLVLSMFRALHSERKLLNSRTRIASWFGEQGLDADQAEAAFESFSTQTKIKRAQRQVARNGVDSTPQLVVAGRYRLSPSLSGNYDSMLATLDQLLEEIRSGNPPN